jgi:hypothetical protein
LYCYITSKFHRTVLLTSTQPPDSLLSAIEKYGAYSELVKQLRYQTGAGRVLIFSNSNTLLWSEICASKPLAINQWSRNTKRKSSNRVQLLKREKEKTNYG